MNSSGQEPVDAHVRSAIASWSDAPTVADPALLGWLHPDRCREIFDAMLGSRHLDLVARRLRAAGAGYYTIGSAGHESNAAVAAALRPTDPALLHYRSGAFYLARAAQRPASEPLRDVLLGLVGAAADPISGGRHKVFGRHELNVIPQTSTIASHLPRAVGVAFSLDRARKLGRPGPWPSDAVVVCSFGDASANHSTALGAINTALHTAHQGVPMPLLLVCEDNGIGISVPTPPGWIARSHGSRDGLAYFAADGTDLPAALRAATDAADWVRSRRRPAFLHLRTVRLMGHAGSDYEPGYRAAADITADYARDPLLCAARLLVDAGVLSPAEVLDAYDAAGREVAALAAEVAALPKLRGAAAITAPIRDPLTAAVATTAGASTRTNTKTGTRDAGPLTVAQAINRALRDALDADPGVLVFGEDVARKGGVYGITRGLRAHAGAARVFDTLLDEQAILGLALGAGLSGLLPIPEIQYLAYLHNAADQIRGEAATLQFFSAGRYRNPMVVRIAGYGYQKGFGGHFHNDDSVTALRDLPGVVIASPARPDDAASMLRGCVAAARATGVVCLFLEPIALYHTRDLHDDGDDGWLAEDDGAVAAIGRARSHGTGADLTLVTFGNGLRMSLRVARRLAARGIDATVLDLRWLAPLPVSDLLAAAGATGRVLVVDETRNSGGVSEGVFAALIDHGYRGTLARVTSADSFIPLGDAALDVLLGEDEVETAALRLMDR